MEKNNSIIRPFIKSWTLDLKLNKSYLGLYATSNSFLFANFTELNFIWMWSFTGIQVRKGG